MCLLCAWCYPAIFSKVAVASHLQGQVFAVHYFSRCLPLTVMSEVITRHHKATAQSRHLWNISYRIGNSSVVLFKPKYRLGHPENHLLSLSKKMLSGSKYPKNVLFNFENRTNKELFDHFWWTCCFLSTCPTQTFDFRYVYASNVGSMFPCSSKQFYACVLTTTGLIPARISFVRIMRNWENLGSSRVPSNDVNSSSFGCCSTHYYDLYDVHLSVTICRPAIKCVRPKHTISLALGIAFSHARRFYRENTEWEIKKRILWIDERCPWAKNGNVANQSGTESKLKCLQTSNAQEAGGNQPNKSTARFAGKPVTERSWGSGSACRPLVKPRVQVTPAPDAVSPLPKSPGVVSILTFIYATLQFGSRFQDVKFTISMTLATWFWIHDQKLRKFPLPRLPHDWAPFLQVTGFLRSWWTLCGTQHSSARTVVV